MKITLALLVGAIFVIQPEHQLRGQEIIIGQIDSAIMRSIPWSKTSTFLLTPQRIWNLKLGLEFRIHDKSLLDSLYRIVPTLHPSMNKQNFNMKISFLLFHGSKVDTISIGPVCHVIFNQLYYECDLNIFQIVLNALPSDHRGQLYEEIQFINSQKHD